MQCKKTLLSVFQPNPTIAMFLQTFCLYEIRLSLLPKKLEALSSCAAMQIVLLFLLIKILLDFLRRYIINDDEDMTKRMKIQSVIKKTLILEQKQNKPSLFYFKSMFNNIPTIKTLKKSSRLQLHPGAQ